MGYWACWGVEGGGLCLACKFQSRLRYPSGALADSQNQFGEGGLASTFLCFCLHLSLPFMLLSSLFITVFLFSPFHPFTSYLPLTPSIWLFVFVSHRCYIPLLVSPLLGVCHQAVINQHSHLVGGRGCEARSLMFTGRWGSGVTGGMTDGLAVWRLWQRSHRRHTYKHACISDHSHAPRKPRAHAHADV